MRNKKTEINSATKWSIISEVVAKIVGPITTMILARVIDIKSFGILASITMIVSFADNIINIGFQRVLIQINLDEEEIIDYCNVCFWCNFILSLFCWLLLIYYSKSIVMLLGIEGKELEIIIAGLVLPISAFSTIQEGLYIKELNFKILFYNRLISVFIPLLITLPIAFLTKNYWALLVGNISLIVVKSIYLTFVSPWKPTFNFSVNILKLIYKLTIANMLDALVYWLASWVDIFFISKLFGAYYSGLYKTSQTLVTSIISLLTAGLVSVAFSSLSLYRNDNEKFIEIFLMFQKGVSILAIPLGVGMYLYKELIVKLLLGDKWLMASEFVGIWGFIITLVSVYGTFSSEAYRAIKKPEISLCVQLINLIFVLFICIISSSLTYEKFVIVRSFSFLQIILLHGFFMKKLFNISLGRMLGNTIYPIISSIIMGIVCIFFKMYFKSTEMQIISIIISIIVYFSIILLNSEYRIIIFSFIKKYKKRS